MKLLVLCLAVTMLAPSYAKVAAQEEITPYGSYYLDSYNSYICPMGGGRLEIWFSVVGDNYMDELGVLSIKLYESTDQKNWTRVKTYSHEKYPSMLGYGEVYHAGYVPYQGIPGRYYKAYVCIWSGMDGNGDTRYKWTSVKRAT